MCSYFEYLNNHKSQFSEKKIKNQRATRFQLFPKPQRRGVFMRELGQKKKKDSFIMCSCLNLKKKSRITIIYQNQVFEFFGNYSYEP